MGDILVLQTVFCQLFLYKVNDIISTASIVLYTTASVCISSPQEKISSSRGKIEHNTKQYLFLMVTVATAEENRCRYGLILL